MKPIYFKVWVAAFALGTALVLTGCGKHEKPNFIYAPEMHYSPAFKAQEVGANRMPVKGTIPRDYQPYAFTKAIDGPGKDLPNPVRRTAEVLARGKALYDTYCIVCHGAQGKGDGLVAAKMQMPPSLLSEKITTWPDGNIYHVMTMGQNVMPSYAAQVQPQDRWAIVHYIRALQRANKPTPQDLAGN
ncbi:MAG: cytochrome c [Bdellovibrionales bacterium]|nr:cytochrome c [Bdellovibrionales bacterium]